MVKQCECGCGEFFHAKRSDMRFKTNTHRQRHYRRVKRAKEMAWAAVEQTGGNIFDYGYYLDIAIRELQLDPRSVSEW